MADALNKAHAEEQASAAAERQAVWEERAREQQRSADLNNCKTERQDSQENLLTELVRHQTIMSRWSARSHNAVKLS